MAFEPSLGDAFISVHADTEPFDREVAHDIEKAANSAEANRSLDKTGEHFGKRISESTSKEVKKHGKDIGDAIEKATEGREVRFRGRFNFFQRLRDRRGSAKSLLDSIEQDIEDVLTKSESGGNGPFSKIGQGIRDAIGAGFNISGKSPLVSVLVPLIGVIVALVAGALQAINSLIGLIAMLPALLGAVGLQVGILYLAFHGLGTAIGAAFQAKNAQELNAAIKDLQPTAQAFVRALLPIKDIFSYLQRAAQINFFLNFGTGPVKDLLAFLNSEAFKGGVKQLAAELGDFFGKLAEFFSNTSFREFVEDLFPATIAFLRRFGPSFITFLTGLVRLADTSLPFLNQIGVMVGNLLEMFGNFLIGVAQNGSLAKWFDSMTSTFATVLDLLGEITQFVAVFLAQLDKAGGKKILEEFANAFEQLTFLLASPVGEKFMKGIIALSIVAIDSFTGLIEIIILLVAGIQWLADTGIPDAIEGLGILVGKIGDFFVFVGNKILDFVHWVGHGFSSFFDSVGAIIGNLYHQATTAIDTFVTSIRDFITGLPDRIRGWAKDFGSILWNAGKDLIHGLIEGAKAMLPDLKGYFGWLGEKIKEWKGPEDKDRKMLIPAGKAVMSGFSAGLKLGGADVRSLLGDFTNNMSRAPVTHFTFGPNSIQVRFTGAVPTQQQAADTGMAVGNGIHNQLTRRDTALAVRTL